MRFAFIDACKDVCSVEFLRRIMQVTSRGFRALRVRPMCQRQRSDMVILANIQEQHSLSLQSHGRPRMTEELQEIGLNQKWAGDISDFWTSEGWLYLAVIPDLHSRRVTALRGFYANPFRVTAWAVSNRMKRDLAIRALDMA